MNRLVLLIAVATAVLYVGTVAIGMRAKNLSMFSPHVAATRELSWAPPQRNSIPAGSEGDSIRRGAQIFDETPIYASQYTGARLSCGSCHAQGGIQPWASPVVGMNTAYPMFTKRAGRVISLRDRIEECFVRSENGSPLPYDSPEMLAIVDYIGWLSQPLPHRRAFVGRGLMPLAEAKPDAVHGARVFSEQCAGCHGDHGQGNPPLFPPLWGPGSFNDGAGMNDIAKMAAFVQHNMPQNRTGILSPQEAYDVAAFIHTQPRPAFNPAYGIY